MSAKPKPSKFQGLFQQATESPLQVSAPEERVEAGDAFEVAAPPEAPASAFPSQTSAPTLARPARLEKGQGERSDSEKRPLGRPPGKRTDKDWKQFSVLLRHEDQLQATLILRSTRDKRDFSTLMQELLEVWLRKQARKS